MEGLCFEISVTHLSSPDTGRDDDYDETYVICAQNIISV
jgi:hypothetical protein